MCGICGIFHFDQAAGDDLENLRAMVAILNHRGPDEAGFYRDDKVALGHARLSIIDLSGGQQPLCNEDRTIWVAFNGEIFNYIELRKELESAGHCFRTNSDTETIVHAYEERGEECLSRFNGQFAFALWDSRSQRLLLARDRLGIRPLFYCAREGKLLFASEIKSIAAHPAVKLEIDPLAIDEVFTFWSSVNGRSAFKGIEEVPPGNYLLVKNGNIKVQKYWQVRYPDFRQNDSRTEADCGEQLRDHLINSTRLRLRADVPVGAYLSGGLDSSIISTIIKKYTDSALMTFSIRFEEPQFDEGRYQDELIKELGTTHSRIECTKSDIARAFPEVIWHTEKPILRTAPAPLFLLSRLVRDSGVKVVLTGEGADEFLGGYNIFKEAKIRRFWAKNPNSPWRPLLLKKLYPYIAPSSGRPSQYWQSFFKYGLLETQLPQYSHILRWNNTSKIKTLFSDELKTKIGERDAIADYISTLPFGFCNWDSLSRAQYLEVDTFLSNYLLNSQGDRVAMAHSVEARFPFLDHNVVEFCNQIPPKYKLYGLTEKHVLKKSFGDEIPPAIIKRSKQPYRAPESACFFGTSAPEYVEEMLSKRRLEKAGLFDSQAVSRLVQKVRGSRCGSTSARDDMAIIGILSAQILHHHFIEEFAQRKARARQLYSRLNIRVNETATSSMAGVLK